MTTSINGNEPVPLNTIPISPETSTNGNSSIPTNGSAEADNSTDSSGPVTVFHNPEHFNVKHPLLNKWTLWFTKPPTGKVSSQLNHPRR
jgi:translation initiation factor 4E